MTRIIKPLRIVIDDEDIRGLLLERGWVKSELTMLVMEEIAMRVYAQIDEFAKYGEIVKIALDRVMEDYPYDDENDGEDDDAP
jgi:hypothetical protein